MTGAEDMSAHLRITELAERLGGLDTREGEHFGELTGQLERVAAVVRDTGSRLDRHGEILAALDGMDQQVLELAGAVAALSEDQGDGEDGAGPKPRPYKPAPAARWWTLRGEERDAAITALAAWVRDIYVPGYGHLAAALPACWPEHDLILYGLDTLSEFWMVLYLSPARSTAALAGQSEFQTRILPLYVAQMAAEARGCQHRAKAARNGAVR